MSKTNNPQPQGEMMPEQILGQMIGGFMISQMIHVAAKLGIADIVADGAKSVTEIAQTCNCHSSNLYRLMRGLSSIGIFNELDNRHFELSPMAALLKENVEKSMRYFAMWAGEPWTWQPFGGLLDSVQSGEPAFPRVFNQDLTQYLNEHSQDAGIFNQVMVERTTPIARAVAAAYDFDSIKKIIDVGGGFGILIRTILKNNPQLKGVLFDLPQVINRVGDLMTKEGLAERCEVLAGDFFDTIPVQGDACILSNVIHDWDDEKAIRLLKNCHHILPAKGKSWWWIMLFRLTIDRLRVK